MFERNAVQVLVAIPGIFHIVRVFMGRSMDDAIESGWLMSGAVRLPPSRLIVINIIFTRAILWATPWTTPLRAGG